MNEEEKKRALRHAKKEENLRLSFKGNAAARQISLRNIAHEVAVKKKNVDDFQKEIDRLLAYPENFINCEKEYCVLFALLEKNETYKSQIKAFKDSLKKINLPNASRRFLI